MIYLLNFFKGSFWGLVFLGGLLYFSHFFPRFSFFGLFICFMPGIAGVIIFSLLIENYELKKGLKNV